MTDPQQVASSLLDKFDLNDAADRRLLHYSGGMRRRLDIAHQAWWARASSSSTNRPGSA